MVSAVTLLFAHRPVFLLSCTECQTCVSAELSELGYLPGLRDRSDRHQGCYPFYLNRPVLFSVLHCIANSTKGKNYPFYVHRPVCLIPRTLAPFLSLARTDREDSRKEI